MITPKAKVKVGLARSWEFQAISSSSSSSAVAFKEVEFGVIVRRTTGEAFVVKSLESLGNESQPDMSSLLVGALHKRLSKKQADLSPSTDYNFVRIPVLADGYCFWHCILRVSLPAEYKSYKRAESGGPISMERLQKEISLAKTTHQEFIHLYRDQPFFNRTIVKKLDSSPQVHLQFAQTICQVSGISLRISLSPEV